MIVKRVASDGRAYDLHDDVAEYAFRPIEGVINMVFRDGASVCLALEGSVFVMTDDGVTVDKYVRRQQE